jgi:hypothetical protein
LVRVPQIEKYNPFSWAEDQFGENLTKELMALYDPARVVSVFRLIPEVDYAAHVDALAVAESEALEAESLAVPMALAMSSSPSNLQLAISNTTNGSVEIKVSWPTTFTNRLDIFASEELVEPDWTVVCSNILTTGVMPFVWEDLNTNWVNRFYIAGNADLDSDFDGIPDAHEVLIYNTDPLDPNSGGNPPPPAPTNTPTSVTLSIKSYNDDVTFTLSLSAGTNQYEVVSAGTQTISNSFDLVKGTSYTVSLMQTGFSQCGGEWGYVADVTGSGIVIDDGNGILGDHWQSDTIQGTVTAAVHVVKIETQTIATAPVDRTRKTIGVGEEVDLTFLPVGLSQVSWSCSGGGDFDQTTGSSVTFMASDIATNSTITATYGGQDFSVTFTIIKPTGVLFENDMILGASVADEINDWYNLYYSAKVYVQPDTVNFGDIKLYESAAPPETEGYFEDKNIPNHDANGGHEVVEYEEGKGSLMHAYPVKTGYVIFAFFRALL